MTDDNDIDELRNRTDVQARTKQTDQKPDELAEALLENIFARSQKGTSRTVGIWDAELAGLADTFDENPDLMRRVAMEAAEASGKRIDEDDVDKSETFRLLILAGLEDVDPDLAKKFRDAVGEVAAKK